MANTFDLQSKIERAICAYLIQQGAGDITTIFPGLATGAIRQSPPLTTILAGNGEMEDFQPGNLRFRNGRILLQDNPAQQPDANPQDAFIAAQERANSTITALVLSDDGGATMDYARRQINAAGRALAVDASNGSDPVQVENAKANADMVDFTLIFWELQDYGTTSKSAPDSVTTCYERELVFECLACNSNVD